METAILTKEQALAKEIHLAFDTSSDMLYAKANEQAGGEKLALNEKVERLKKLGFSNCEEVGKLERLKEDEPFYEFAGKYRKKYPYLKFITKRQLNELLRKYSLVTGIPEKFIGSIPEEKLFEIEYWLDEIDPDDIEDNSFEYKIWNQGKINEEIAKERDRIRGMYGSSAGGLLSEMVGRVYNDYAYTLTIKSKERLPEFELIREFEKKGVSKEEFMHTSKQCVLIEDNKQILIAAPEPMFKPDPPKLDPIVLQPVKGGYLVLAKWGMEANDPELVIPELKE